MIEGEADKTFKLMRIKPSNFLSRLDMRSISDKNKAAPNPIGKLAPIHTKIKRKVETNIELIPPARPDFKGPSNKNESDIELTPLITKKPKKPKKIINNDDLKQDSNTNSSSN